MTLSLAQAVALAACAVTLTGCATDPESDAESESATTVAQHSAESTASTRQHGDQEARTRAEQAFVNDLTRSGLSPHTASGTTIEVGVGICHSLAEGERPDVILDRLRPLTSALAAQHSDKDTQAVGRVLIDASRAHLCT